MQRRTAWHVQHLYKKANDKQNRNETKTNNKLQRYTARPNIGNRGDSSLQYLNPHFFQNISILKLLQKKLTKLEVLIKILCNFQKRRTNTKPILITVPCQNDPNAQQIYPTQQIYKHWLSIREPVQCAVRLVESLESVHLVWFGEFMARLHSIGHVAPIICLFGRKLKNGN